MKLLLDECLPLDFRHEFPGHEVHTVEWAGFKGKKNGELLELAEVSGYQVLLTVDQGIPHQTHSATRTIALMMLRSRTNQLADLRLLAERILEALESIEPGQTVSVG